MGFPVQNEGTASFRYPLIIEGRLEALMRTYKQTVHSCLCGNDMETSRGASAEIQGRHVWERDKRRCVLKHFSHRVHFEFHIGTKNLKFAEDHPMNIHVQFGFNHICSF
jgi:hypothetical protein